MSWTSEVTLVCDGPFNQSFGHVTADSVAQAIADTFVAEISGFIPGPDSGSITGDSNGRALVAIVLNGTNTLNNVLVIGFSGASRTTDIPVNLTLTAGAQQISLTSAGATTSAVVDGNFYLCWHVISPAFASVFTGTVTLELSGVAATTVNCACSDSISGNKTLLQLRTEMMKRLGYAAQASSPPPGMASLLDAFLLDAQDQLYLQYKEFRTERFFKWTTTTGGRFYGLVDNEQEEQDCELILDPKKVTWVGFEDSNARWQELAEGIPPELYTLLGTSNARPQRYEIRGCLEIFPAPDQEYTLWVKGHFVLGDFTSDDDYVTLDDRAVFLLALGNAKLHYRQPDAQAILRQAGLRVQNLVAAAHHTARFVPGAQRVAGAPQPVFIPAPNT